MRRRSGSEGRVLGDVCAFDEFWNGCYSEPGGNPGWLYRHQEYPYRVRCRVGLSKGVGVWRSLVAHLLWER
jgi:hypothetical protein